MITLFNFDGTCLVQPFAAAPGTVCHDCTHLEGARRFCDADAAAALRRMVASSGLEGLHWFGSGHYHYLSRFYAELVDRPFALAVADLHTDMQETPYEGLISCGGWIRDLMKECSLLRAVLLVGTDDALAAAQPAVEGPPLRMVTASALAGTSPAQAADLIPAGLPVWLSIDKDVLRAEDAVTDWDNGVMTLDWLTDWLEATARSHVLLGADLCGDTSSPEALVSGPAAAVNARSSKCVADALRPFIHCSND